MKTALTAGVALVLTTPILALQVASAADLPVKSSLQRGPVAISYDWTGLYIGGYWGVSIGQSSLRTPTGPFDEVGQVDISKGS